MSGEPKRNDSHFGRLYASCSQRFPDRQDQYIVLVVLCIAVGFFIFQLNHLSHRLANPQETLGSTIEKREYLDPGVRICTSGPADLVCTLTTAQLDEFFFPQSFDVELSVPSSFNASRTIDLLREYLYVNISVPFSIHPSHDRINQSSTQCCFLNLDKRAQWKPDGRHSVVAGAMVFVHGDFEKSKRYRDGNNQLFRVNAFQLLYSMFKQPEIREAYRTAEFNENLNNNLAYMSAENAQIVQFTEEILNDHGDVTTTYQVRTSFLEPVIINETSAKALIADLGLDNVRLLQLNTAVEADSFLIRSYFYETGYQFSDWVSDIGGLVSVIFTIFGLLFPTSLIFERRLRFKRAPSSSAAEYDNDIGLGQSGLRKRTSLSSRPISEPLLGGST